MSCRKRMYADNICIFSIRYFILLLQNVNMWYIYYSITNKTKSIKNKGDGLLTHEEYLC